MNNNYKYKGRTNQRGRNNLSTKTRWSWSVKIIDQRNNNSPLKKNILIIILKSLKPPQKTLKNFNFTKSKWINLQDLKTFDDPVEKNAWFLLYNPIRDNSCLRWDLWFYQERQHCFSWWRFSYCFLAPLSWLSQSQCFS